MDLVENKADKTEEQVKQANKHEEYQYLEKIAEIIKYGNTRIDRTKIGTKSIFGTQARYSLRNGAFFIVANYSTKIKILT